MYEAARGEARDEPEEPHEQKDARRDDASDEYRDACVTHVPVSLKVQRAAASVAARERKRPLPSDEPSRSSQARSGCGMSPRTFRPREQIPAMWSREPLRFDSSVNSPCVSQ